MIPLNVVTEHSSQCHMCGGCCEIIPVPVSPEDFERLIAENPLGEAARVGRMLRGRYLGPDPWTGGDRHLYGPCPNLVYDGDIGLCAIHDCRPAMCRDFPDYGGNVTYPAYIRGCGYNAHPEDGCMDLDTVKLVAAGVLAPSFLDRYVPPRPYTSADEEKVTETALHKKSI